MCAKNLEFYFDFFEDNGIYDVKVICLLHDFSNFARYLRLFHSRERKKK